MFLPTVLSYQEFLEKLDPELGPDVYFLYIREPNQKAWKFEALYLCQEDVIEDGLIYEREGIEVDFRRKPTAGGRFEAEEINDNLEGAGWCVNRFIARECANDQSFEIMVEIL